MVLSCVIHEHFHRHKSCWFHTVYRDLLLMICHVCELWEKSTGQVATACRCPPFPLAMPEVWYILALQSILYFGAFWVLFECCSSEQRGFIDTLGAEIGVASFHFHFVNQFHLLMLISTHLSLLHFLHPSPFHSKLKTYLLVNPFHHRSLTIDTPDWVPRLMGPVLIGFSSWFFMR